MKIERDIKRDVYVYRRRDKDIKKLENMGDIKDRER